MDVHHEVERTYQPGPDEPVPDLTRLPSVASVGAPHSVELTATYFDSLGLPLTRAGVSLRRRVGGTDEGWHLKIPSGAGRDEIHLPLGRSQRTVPVALRRVVLAWTRNADLAPIATVVTHRTAYDLLDVDGGRLAELADDRVSATAEGAPQPLEWREWELELDAGDPALLKAADKLLRKAGVPLSESPRKIVRALGDRLSPPVNLGPIGPDRPAGRVLQLRITEQVAELLRRDSEVRRGLPSGVHQARVVCRRLRSALATYRPLLDREVTDPIRVELQWLQEALGEARDAHVVHQRLGILVDDDRHVVGPVRRRLDRTYDAKARDAQAVVTEVLASERYLRLLDDLDTLAAAPPWTDQAEQDATTVLRPLVRKDWKRLAARVDALEAAGDDRDARDHALHEVRKAAKRLRYAVETVQPVWGRKTKRLRRFAKTVTQVLGEHQDTVVSRADLLAVAAEAAAAGEDAFTYGRLHHGDEVLADELRERFARAWSDASPEKLTAWLR
jgi:CHAD domain-containing protein